MENRWGLKELWKPDESAFAMTEWFCVKAKCDDDWTVFLVMAKQKYQRHISDKECI